MKSFKEKEMESLILGILFCYHYIMVICMLPKVTIKLVQLLNIHLMALIRLALIFNPILGGLWNYVTGRGGHYGLDGF